MKFMAIWIVLLFDNCQCQRHGIEIVINSGISISSFFRWIVIFRIEKVKFHMEIENTLDYLNCIIKY